MRNITQSFPLPFTCHQRPDQPSFEVVGRVGDFVEEACGHRAWFVDALFPTPHGLHAHAEECVEERLTDAELRPNPANGFWRVRAGRQIEENLVTRKLLPHVPAVFQGIDEFGESFD